MTEYKDSEIPYDIKYLKDTRDIKKLGYFHIKDLKKYYPDFLETAENLSANAKQDILDYCCENSNNKHPITAKRAVSLTIDILSPKEEGYIPYIAPEKIADYLKLAQRMSAPVTDMKKLFTALQPHMDYFNKQKSADEETLTRYAQCEAKLEVANDRADTSLKAKEAFDEIFNIKDSMKKLRKKEDQAELDSTIDTFYQDVLAGRDVQLKIKPKGFLGFTSANEKELQKKAKKLSDKIKGVREDPAAFDILKTIGGSVSRETAGEIYTNYWNCTNDKYKLQNELQRFSDIVGKKKALKSFKLLNKTYDDVKQATAAKKADLKTRGRTRLGMKLDGQEFNGKPLEGLVNEDKMAQVAYKKKIDKLKAKIEASAKEHLEEQTGETPQKDKNGLRKGKAVEDAAKQGTTVNPGETLKNMKLLKEYKKLVKD